MLQTNIELAPHTTFKVGGAAAYFCEVTSETELLQAITYAAEQSLPWRVLGGGSNLLVADEGVSGLVIKMSIKGYQAVTEGTNVLLTVGAGEVLDDVVKRSVADKWWGLENLSHIPGTVGATPVQNVGAYGVEVADLIASVRVLDTVTHEWATLSAAECLFGYRDSVFKHDTGARYVITTVTFHLTNTPRPVVSYRDLAEQFFDVAMPTQQHIRDAIITIRSKKFPDWHKVGTAGSFFKNPIISGAAFTDLHHQYPNMPHFKLPDGTVKIPLGYILDKIVDIKGVRHGAVGSYEGQALVIVKYGDATATEIAAFANWIRDQVFAKINIAIEWEVTRW